MALLVWIWAIKTDIFRYLLLLVLQNVTRVTQFQQRKTLKPLQLNFHENSRNFLFSLYVVKQIFFQISSVKMRSLCFLNSPSVTNQRNSATMYSRTFRETVSTSQLNGILGCIHCGMIHLIFYFTKFSRIFMTEYKIWWGAQISIYVINYLKYHRPFRRKCRAQRFRLMDYATGRR